MQLFRDLGRGNVNKRTTNFQVKKFQPYLTFLFVGLLGQETAKRTFSLQVKLPPTHLSNTHDGGRAAERPQGETMTPGPMGFRGPMGFGFSAREGVHQNDSEKSACEA